MFPLFDPWMPEESPEPLEVSLLRRVARGDQAAFADLYDRLSGVLYSIASRILGDPKDAEDVLQDAFIQIWDKAGAFDPESGSPLGWAATLTRNRAIDRLRATRRRRQWIEDVASAAGSAPEAQTPEVIVGVEAREQAARIRSALQLLPADQRQAIELAFFGGLTQNEIAARLHQPLGTVKARIRRGMLRLREALAGPGEAEQRREKRER